MTTARAPLPLPEVNSLLPDDPEWDETGLLPADKALAPLPLKVPAWDYQPVTGAVTVLTVFWNAGTFDRRQWDGSVPTLPPADLLFNVPVTLLTPGVHELWYTVLNAVGNEDESLHQTVTVDLTPPALGSNNGQLQFDSTQITEKYLEDHGDLVEGRILAYSGGKPGDVVSWYWNGDPFDVDDADLVATRTLLRGDIGQPIVLPFDGDMIRARGDGTRYAFYFLTDRAGNVSGDSRAVQLDVETTPVPRVLPPCRVNEAPGSSSSATLNPANALNGATVVIPDTAVINDDETVEVQWAAPDTYGAFTGTSPVTPGTRAYKIPSTCIAPHFARSLPVYYLVTEPGVAQPHRSQNFTLRVSDLTGNWPTIQSGSVSNGQLSLAGVSDAARFTLKSWQFMGTDQFITVSVLGVDVNGAARTVPVLTEEPVSEVAQIINVGQIAKADLQGFKLNYPLEVRVRVSFDNKQSWKAFPSLRPTLVA
ncbi:hypothetical protein EGJ27_10815 [Pseudomonas sp. v388]|uniref:hypothetical protein n=1 Tax=Pseudomonas sp. v388 TaxID=2479849 RepID=UPI000F79C236|nr:hypothetical protein [Pseudomonas sp. v388]RRV07179.1 hypothetical protein EGJ27_10815 [Pseudomonas sp. v388]